MQEVSQPLLQLSRGAQSKQPVLQGIVEHTQLVPKDCPLIKQMTDEGHKYFNTIQELKGQPDALNAQCPPHLRKGMVLFDHFTRVNTDYPP